MPTHADVVSLSIGGKTQSKWQRYEIDSDLLVAADGWQFGLPTGKNLLPDFIEEGAPIEVRLDGELILSGFVDDIDTITTKEERGLALSGRDGAGQLLDCSAAIFSGRQLTLQTIVARYIRPLGFTSIRIDAEGPSIRERVNVEPGDSVWDALSHAAEANGYWPWFEPDGTLVVGGPDYTKPPVATLVMRESGKGNNVMEVRVSRSAKNRYSELTVLGQAPGTYIEDGKNTIRATAKDPAVKRFRPRIVVDHESENTKLAQYRARKLLADGRLEGFNAIVKVKGHRTPDGELWKPGARVECDFEKDRVKGVLFLMGRRFYRGVDGGKYTELRFKEDGVWVLDAHPHRRKYRLGRNQVAGKIIDAEGDST